MGLAYEVCVGCLIAVRTMCMVLHYITGICWIQSSHMVAMKHAVLCVVMPNSLVEVDQHFGGTCSFLMVEGILNKLSELTGYFVVIVCLSHLKMEVMHSFRTSLKFYQTTQMTSQKVALFSSN